MRRSTAIVAAGALLLGPALSGAGERVLRTPEYRELQQRLCRGWNTWSADSVVTHVHLPDGFAIRLGLKNAGRGRPYQNSFFQASRVENRPEAIRLGPHADDGSYTELTLEWASGDMGEKDPLRLLVQSATDGDDELLLITVQQRSPLRPAHLIVEGGFYWGRSGVVRREGPSLVGRSDPTTGRAFIVRSTAADVHDPFLATNTPYLSVALEGEVAVYTGETRSLDEVKSAIQTRRAAHVASLAGHGDLSDVFTAMQTILAWNVTYDPENDRAISPVSRLWSANWGGYVLFDWDTYFAAFMYGIFDPDLAFANAVEITKGITGKGFIPNFHSAYQIKSEDRSQPPVGSLMALEIYRRHPQRWFLVEVYDELLSWNRWWPAARDCGGVLCWGSDPEKQILDGIVNTWQAALYESGLDNSPMYDGVPFDKDRHLLEQADVGLTSLYVADCHALAEIATLLGKAADAQELRKRGVAYARGLATLWSEDAGIYLNRRTDTGVFSPKLSPTSFYPLLAGVPTQRQAQRMVDEHYFDPEQFHGEWVIPSIARDVEGFEEQDYWRGRIWGPMNFLVYLGLRNYDLPEARRDLVRRSHDLLMKSWKTEGAIYENYNALTGVGNDVASSDAYYHWGALLGVLSMLERGD